MAASDLNSNSGCEVFVRWRPLVQQELESGDKPFSYNHVFGSKSKTWKVGVQKSFISDNPDFDFGENNTKKPTLRKRGGFSGKGFSGIIDQNENNVEAYTKAIAPLVNRTILKGKNGSCFAYGMTGSGKTHTMLGYHEKGMYSQAAEQIVAKLQEFKESSPEINFAISVRFAELYNGHFYNLLDDRKQSQILEGKNGQVLLRSTEPTEDGLYLSGNIRDIVCHSVEEIDAVIRHGCTLRQAGTSTTHCQSSRSHAVIEFEIVTEDLCKLREEYMRLDAEYTRLLNDVKDYHAEKEFAKRIGAHKKKQKQEKAKHFAIGGSIVFCDLAGAEIGLRSTNAIEESQTIQDRLEGKKINMSLMALAEVLRNLSLGKKRIGYRASPLTMYLRKFIRGEDCNTVMMAAVAPSTNYKRFTVQTLKYAKLLAESTMKKKKNVKTIVMKKKVSATALVSEDASSLEN